MKYPTSLTLLVALVGAAPLSADQPDTGIRTWTSRDGRSIQAEFVSLIGSGDSAIIQLRLQDGRQAPIPLTRLSDEDQAWLASRDERAVRSRPVAALQGDLRDWKQMTVPFPTEFRGRLIDAVRRGERRFITIRHEDGAENTYSVDDFWTEADKTYLEPFLASARQEEDPWEQARKAAAQAAEEERIRRQGYPDDPEPAWSDDNLTAYQAVRVAAAAVEEVNEQISTLRQAHAERRRRLRDGFADMSARAAAQSGRPGVLGRAPEVTELQIPDSLLEQRSRQQEALDRALTTFQEIAK